jgi:hypothetical protein
MVTTKVNKKSHRWLHFLTGGDLGAEMAELF